MKTSFRVVPDTNVVIASEKSTSESSPNREFFNRWRNDEFEILAQQEFRWSERHECRDTACNATFMSYYVVDPLRSKRTEILYSDDTLLEYIEKMRELGIPEKITRKLVRAMLELGRHVSIMFYHLPLYPSDPDDIAFLLCAENGNATHIVSYDPHLEEIDHFYAFRVCGTLKFLFELRKELSEKMA